MLRISLALVLVSAFASDVYAWPRNWTRRSSNHYRYTYRYPNQNYTYYYYYPAATTDTASSPNATNTEESDTRVTTNGTADTETIDSETTHTDTTNTDTTNLETSNTETTDTESGNTNPTGVVSGPQAVANWKAQQMASRGIKGQHLGGGFGGANAEGVGFSGYSAQHALNSCCFTGQRTLASFAVVRGYDGWYAVKLYW